MNDANQRGLTEQLRPRSGKEVELERLSKFPPVPDTPAQEDQVMGVLLSDRIQSLCDKYSMIYPLNKEHLKPASYELSVGAFYSRSGKTCPLEAGEQFSIEPFEVVLIQTLETLNLPPFLIARWNIRIKWAYRGLLWVGAPQVDPGFRGFLSCPLYNLSNKSVTLTHGDAIAAMDFVMTTPVTNKSQRYDWRGRTRVLFSDYEKDKLESALLTEAADKLKVMEKKSIELDSGLQKTREGLGATQSQLTSEVANIRASLADATEKTRERIGNDVSNIQNRIDSYTARTLTVLAVLFAALGLAVSRSPDISYLSSATPVAAIALWFALRSFYLAGSQSVGGSVRPRMWFEITAGLVLAVSLLTIQYKITARNQSDWAATREAALSAQAQVRDMRHDAQSQQEIERRLDAIDQRIDALRPPNHR